MDDIRAVIEAAGFERPSHLRDLGGGTARPCSSRDLSRTVSAPSRCTARWPAFSKPPTTRTVSPRQRSNGSSTASRSTGGPAGRSVPSCSTLLTRRGREFIARYVRGACSPRMARRDPPAQQRDRRPLDSADRQRADAGAAQHRAIRSCRSSAAGTSPNICPAPVRSSTTPTTTASAKAESAWYLDELEEFLTGHRDAGGSDDRVLATVLFTDIVGSTERASALGDHAWRRLLDEHDTIARAARRARSTARSSRPRATACSHVRRSFPSRRLRVGDPRGARISRPPGPCRRPHRRAGARAATTSAGSACTSGPASPASPVRARSGSSRTVKDLTAGSGLEFDARGAHALKGVPDEWELYALTA